MSARLNAGQLEPLLKVARRVGAGHLSVFGSAISRPLAKVGDIDIHAVVQRMERSAYDSFVAAAKTTIQTLAKEAAAESQVELRHGPFKPEPGKARTLQLHLILDDGVSLRRSPYDLIMHRATTGKLLYGSPLLPQVKKRAGLATRLKEAERAICGARDALLKRRFAFRHWVFGPNPRFVTERVDATTPWEMNCLLRGSANTADLHYFATVLTGWLDAASAASNARPLLEQLRDLPDRWQELPARWEHVRDQAVTILDKRFDDLAGLAPGQAD